MMQIGVHRINHQIDSKAPHNQHRTKIQTIIKWPHQMTMD